MKEHPVLKRYEAHCAYIRKWCNRPHDEIGIPAHEYLMRWPNSPALTSRIQMLMDDMALAIRQLTAVEDEETGETK